MQTAARIQETDRWNSFDRFRDTTRSITEEFEAAGAGVEVVSLPTGAEVGTGRWRIQHAMDIRGAALDIVQPVRERLTDWKDNPWSVVQWSAATPPRGFTGELVVIDTPEELSRLNAGALAGKVVLTRMDPKSQLVQWSQKRAGVIITDRPVRNHPGATAWTKWGWGGIQLEQAAARPVGMVLSARQGRRLRKLVEQGDKVVVQARVDVRLYAGSHDVVSGLVRGVDDPQDEVWAIAHHAEPGALDNASGVATTIEIARVLQAAIDVGQLPPPRRTIRLVDAFECYGFFTYLENQQRLQPPLAGVCLDTLGARPSVCDGRLSWRATIPMSAQFVNAVGEVVLRAALRHGRRIYRLSPGTFISTSDTLLGDPRYGFPCPWLTTHYRDGGKTWDQYHSSADLPNLLSAAGLEACSAGMSAYLYYLANAQSDDVVELAALETSRVVSRVRARKTELSRERAAFLRAQHHESMLRLQRWLWGGDRRAVLGRLGECEARVRQALSVPARRRRTPAAARQVPRRTAFLSPTLENTPESVAQRIRDSKLPAWSLFWADGDRDLADIAELVRGETGKPVRLQQVVDFFAAHHDLGYVQLVPVEELLTRRDLVRDLRQLGIKPGMDLMVHSSLSRIGPVRGGADTVVDALLEAIGPEGTLLMPSFHHRAAQVFNPLATPTTNGAIPDAFWRRPETIRSLHPTHAVAAQGPRAEAYCRDHLQVGIWHRDSPIGRLVHGGGWILALGVDHSTTTAYHVAEVSMGAPCLDPFASRELIVDEEGNVQEVPGLAWRDGRCPVSPRRLDSTLNRRGLQQRGLIGRAPSALVRAIDLWNVRREHLRSACRRCDIRPNPVRPQR